MKTTDYNTSVKMTLEERIKNLIDKKEEIQSLNDEGEDFDYSIMFDMLEEAAELLVELQTQLNRLNNEK
jgi:hypothetical protein